MALMGINNRMDYVIIGVFVLIALSIISTWFNQGITFSFDTLKELALVAIPIVMKYLNDCSQCPATKFAMTRAAEFEQFKSSLERQ